MKKKTKDELRIRKVAESVVSDLLNIAKHKGVTLSSFLKPELRGIADKYPEHMKRPPAID